MSLAQSLLQLHQLGCAMSMKATLKEFGIETMLVEKDSVIGLEPLPSTKPSDSANNPGTEQVKEK